MSQSFVLGPIFNQQNNDKIRLWQITINLYNDTNRKMVPITGLDMKIPKNTFAEYYTTNGLVNMKMTDSLPTTILTGKNIGKKNETNVLTQAYSDCLSKYNLKIKAGYSENAHHQVNPTKETFPFPMALKQWKDFKNKLVYPLYVQPKLDGLRMIAMLDIDGKVVLKTRRLHDISKFDKLKKELQSMYDLSTDKNLILDGELYAHGMDLQNISGIVRAENDRDDEKDTLQYWVFDCFSIDNSTQRVLATSGCSSTESFDIRFERLNSFVSGIKSNLVVVNETILIPNESDSDKYYEHIISDGYEGIIYKSINKPYEYSFNKEKRSSWYLKRKQRFDDEFEIVSFGEGKGKDTGCVVFVLKTKEGIEFNSVPNGTYDYRKELYQQCLINFNQFKGKMAKVQFEDYSTEKVPLRNRMLMIRDLTFD